MEGGKRLEELTIKFVDGRTRRPRQVEAERGLQRSFRTKEKRGAATSCSNLSEPLEEGGIRLGGGGVWWGGKKKLRGF